MHATCPKGLEPTDAALKADNQQMCVGGSLDATVVLCHVCKTGCRAQAGVGNNSGSDTSKVRR